MASSSPARSADLPAAFAAFRPATTGDSVVQTLRAAIVAGNPAPGTPLRETWLSSALGVSRNTVREAMRVLTGEGLVRYEPHRGVVVAEVGPDDVIDLYRVREAVELAAVRHVVERRHPLDALDNSVAQLRAAAMNDDHLGATEADTTFHAWLVATLESPRLARTHRVAMVELRLALIGVDRDDDLQRLADSHTELLHALRGRSVKAAIDAARDHLVVGRQMVLDAL